MSEAIAWNIIHDFESRIAMTLDGRLLSNVGVLAAVIEAGSFARAAEALGLTPSGVSRAIARLEARIGVRLLDRTTRSLNLTDEGRLLYANINPLVLGIEDAVTRASGSAASVRGRLRVNTDAFTSRLLLSPHLRRFLELYPELSLELIARDQLGDLVAEGFDIAVRFGEPPSSSLVARKLIETRVVTVAAPDYLERHGRPQKPAELTSHACIHVRSPVTGQPLVWAFQRGRKVVKVPTSGRLLLTDAGTLLETCLAGTGVAQIKALGIQALLDQGRLVDLFPDWPDDRFSLYALYPSRHLPAAKVRAFIDFVVAALSAKANHAIHASAKPTRGNRASPVAGTLRSLHHTSAG
jgi:DNA-binding transcriptional LysR family regulator